MTVTKLTAREKAQHLDLQGLVHKVNEQRYVQKTPVSDVDELKALKPEEGEKRQVQDNSVVIEFVYNAGIDAADAIHTPDDAAYTGGWRYSIAPSDSDAWKPEFDYLAGDTFFIVPAAEAVDASGDEVLPGVLYNARYVDSNGALADTTSGATLDATEIAKMEIEQGELTTEEIVEADLEGIILVD